MAGPYVFPREQWILTIANQTGGAARSGSWLGLAKYTRIGFLVYISQGDVATTAITVDKATASTPSNQSTGITLRNWWKCEDTATTVDTWSKGASATSITSSATGTGDSLYYVDVGADELGEHATAGLYDWVQVELGASHASNRVCVLARLYDARYPKDVPLTALS